MPSPPGERRTRGPTTSRSTGSGDVLTFVPVELLATKFRALAQRRKCRDLNDLNVAYEILGLDNTALAEAAAHYSTAPASHRPSSGPAPPLTAPTPRFTNDTGVYLIDPEQAQHPTALINRWILCSDRHLDIPYAQRAYEISPSNRKQRTIEDIRHRLLHETARCPIYRANNETPQRCEHHLDVIRTCPLHGRPLGA